MTNQRKGSAGRAATAFGAFVLALLLVVGCSQPADQLDTGATQSSVGREVADLVAPGVAATTCPAKIRRGRGGTFVCRVRLGGNAGTLVVRVTQMDDDGAISVVPEASVLSGDDLARRVKTALHKRLKRAFQVDCGGGAYKVRKPDAVVTCTARDRSTRRQVAVTITDSAGTISVAIEPAGGG